jgi:uncharacterized protein
MDEVEIRAVTSDSDSRDLDELLWEVLWKPIGLPQTIRQSFKLEGESVELVAVAHSEVVGGLVANWLSPIEVELRHLAVKPEAQGQTIGSRLVKRLISIVSEWNCSTVQTISRNTSAGFFRKLGFVLRPGKAPEHPVFKKHGITFELLQFECRKVEPAVVPDRTTMITEIGKIVEEACARETNVFGYGIWTHHIAQVAENGKRLARMFCADAEIVEIAALLHDYASIKDQALYQDHHVHGPMEAEKLLRHFGYPQERIEAVKECIAAHRGSVSRDRRSPEAECLANADAMTHIEQVPSLLELAFVQHGMGIDKGTRWVRAKLERSWNKLSPQVQEMMQEKYQAALITLQGTDSTTSDSTPC